MSADTLKRLKYIDIAKGIGMLLVILGHYECTNDIRRWIFAFHMPLFVFISGYLFKNLTKSVKSLFTAYLCGSVIGSALYILLNFSLESVGKSLVAIVGGCSAPFYVQEMNTALWFLTGLIVIEILHMLGKSIKVDIIFLIAFPLFGALFGTTKSHSYIPWNIDVAMMLYPFFWLGDKVKKIDIESLICTNFRRVVAALLSIISLVVVYRLAAINVSVNIFRLVYGKNIWMYYFNGLLGTLGIVIISFVLSTVFKECRILTVIGENTLFILCYHQILIWGCIEIVNRSGLQGYVQIGLWILLFIIMLILLLVAALLTRKYVPILIGAQKNKNKN